MFYQFIYLLVYLFIYFYYDFESHLYQDVHEISVLIAYSMRKCPI